MGKNSVEGSSLIAAHGLARRLEGDAADLASKRAAVKCVRRDDRKPILAMRVTLEELSGGRWRARSGVLPPVEGDSEAAAIAGLLRANGASDYKLMNSHAPRESPKDMDADGDSYEAAERRWRKDVRDEVKRLMRGSR